MANPAELKNPTMADPAELTPHQLLDHVLLADDDALDLADRLAQQA